jgi:hypothetical protein
MRSSSEWPIGHGFQMPERREHANSYKYYGDLSASREELSAQLAAGNYLEVASDAPMPRYIAKMTSQPKVVDMKQTKFEVQALIAARNVR